VDSLNRRTPLRSMVRFGSLCPGRHALELVRDIRPKFPQGYWDPYQGEGLLDGEDASSVTLAGLDLRVSERFTYDYAFFSNLTSWRHDIRVQAIAPPRGRQPHPWCCGGSRGAPPEDCGGPEVFVALRQEHSAWQATVRLAELMRLLLDAPPGRTVRSVLGQDALDELPELLYWARIDSFDKAAVNAALVTLCRKDTS
jgi:Plasmid pRiA4b ORF-3-like protein